MSIASHAETPPVCLPPRPTRAPASFALPKGAWDTHAHVIGGGPDAPFVSARGYTPPAASAETYVAMLDAAGLDFGVVIQISVHGADNRLIADALKRYPKRLRGVVSIAGDESDQELEALRDLGVCGIRLNEHFAGGSGGDQLGELAARCRTLGWHVDLGLTAARLRELAPQIAALDLPVVLDHMGAPNVASGVTDADFAAVLELAALSHVWVKLSGSYRFTGQAAPYDDVVPFVRALYEAAPTRSIWAADWPNVAIFDAGRLPATGELLDALNRQLDDPARLKAVLVDNPLRLYGLPGSAVAQSPHA